MGREATRFAVRLGLAAVALLAAAAPAQAAGRQDLRRGYHPALARDSAGLAVAKQQAQQRAALADPLAQLSAPTGGPRASVIGTLNQPGLAAGDNQARNSGTPPDSTGAVGPNDYIEFVNSVVRIYSKADLTTAAATAQLDTFVGDTNNAVFDPQIQFDPVADRWFYLADDCAAGDCSTTNLLAYGFSKTNDPNNLTTDWCNYSIRTDNVGGAGLFDDYPKLGHNDTHLIFGTNVFGPVTFESARIWTIAKPASGTITTCPAAATPHYYSGTAASPTKDGTLASAPLRTTDGDFAFTPVPANTQDSSANGYVVAADGAPGNQIMAWHVDSTGTLVANGNISVTTFGAPANVPQPGTSDVLDSSDTRLTQAVAHADPDASGAEAIWTQHTIDSASGRSVDRWYELLPATTTKRQEGDISNSSNFVFNGAISPTMSGNDAVIQYNVGSGTTTAQIRASSRLSSATLGSMGGEKTLASNSNIDQDFSCPSNDATAPSCRWGDYAAASPDPSNTDAVWGTNQLNGTPNADNPEWATRNFALTPIDAEPTASFTMAPTPAFTGKQVSFDGSGSFDPDGGSIVSYDWDFGDGTQASSPNPNDVTHTYAAPGNYTVTLTVTDDDQSLTGTSSQQLTVLTNRPTASFTVAPTSVIRGQAVSFDGSASTDTEAPGGIAGYAWDFDGNGTTDQTTSSPIVTHSYSTLGLIPAKLVVTDSDDGAQSDPATQSVTVKNVPPTAQLSFTPAAPETGQAVAFSAAGSNDPDGTIADYRWDLDGDGVFETDTGTSPSASRSYATAGTFPVSVRVQDSDGASATAGTGVRVVTASSMTQQQQQQQDVLKLVLKFSKKAKLAKLLTSGLSGTVSCGRGCTTKLTLKLSKKVARKLKTKTIVAKKTVVVAAAGSSKTRVKLTKAARKALKNIKTLSMTLTGTAVDSAGHSSTAKLTIKIRR